MRVRSLRRIARVAVFVGVMFVLAACSTDGPMSALDPEGPVAQKEHNLFKPVFWIMTAIFFIVEGLIIYAAIRFRDRKGREEPKQIHGNAKLEFTWTLIPALILLGVAIPTVVTIFEVEAKPVKDDVTIRVVGAQWWWQYEYLDTEPRVITANELVIPKDRTITLQLESADVIHSFWAPKLFGKRDLVPGRTNLLQFSADREGIYHGQCAEFCAIAHADMRLRVRVLSQQDFAAWVVRQQQPAQIPTTGDAARGAELFASNACIGCHAIRGLEGAAGRTGPDLTHFADRTTFGAGLYDMDEEDLFEWVKNARNLKPGVLMIPFDDILTDEQLRQIVAFLLTLR